MLGIFTNCLGSFIHSFGTPLHPTSSPFVALRRPSPWQVADLELGQMVFAETLQDGEYSGRVQDPRAYHAVCGDLLQRWIFPVVPEHAIGGLTTRYRRSHTTVGTNAVSAYDISSPQTYGPTT